MKNTTFLSPFGSPTKFYITSFNNKKKLGTVSTLPIGNNEKKIIIEN